MGEMAGEAIIEDAADPSGGSFGLRDAERIGANRLARALRAAMALAGVALLAACASHGGPNAGRQTAYYEAHAHGRYRAPGPRGDPWGPYIRQASQRFDVPQAWIRQVMKVESGGHEYMHGHLTVSSAGAMGLMQLEPQTYREMAAEYNLGNDPFNPHDNIMAGTAYIREMYEIYGSPGFLAAYNAGPGRLDDFLDQKSPLPAETRRYVAMIAPKIEGIYPAPASANTQLAMNTPPVTAGTSGSSADETDTLNAEEATAQTRQPRTSHGAQPVVAARAPIRNAAPQSGARPVVSHSVLAQSAPSAQPVVRRTPPKPAPAHTPQIRLASARPVPASHHASSYHRPRGTGPSIGLMPTADAATPPAGRGGGGGWAIQVGAYDSEAHAKAALGIAELSAVAMLIDGKAVIEPLGTEKGMLYRARFVDLPRSKAVAACHRLSVGPTGCAVVSPDAS